MGKIRLVFHFLMISILSFITSTALADDSGSTVAGLYKTVLMHEKTNFYQPAFITLRTTSIGGNLKISANVQVFFGDTDSNEFISYEFDDCPMNLLTRQVTMKNEKNNVAFIGYLKAGNFEGDWYSSLIGRVGKFSAIKDGEPKIPENGILVKSLTGHYRGTLQNTNPESNLPERLSVSFVTTQDTSGAEPTLKITGNTRLYLGDFGSIEYVETKFTDVQFNFYNRYLTAKTADYGLTFKGYMSHDGVFNGVVFADGIGEAAKVNLKRYP